MAGWPGWQSCCRSSSTGRRSASCTSYTSLQPRCLWSSTMTYIQQDTITTSRLQGHTVNVKVTMTSHFLTNICLYSYVACLSVLSFSARQRLVWWHHRRPRQRLVWWHHRRPRNLFINHCSLTSHSNWRHRSSATDRCDINTTSR